MATASRASSPRVPVIDRASAPELAEFIRSTAVQQLVADRADQVHLVRVKSYAGQAFVSRDGPGMRGVRLAARDKGDFSEIVFVLCHELAHHIVGLEEKHSWRWRDACADLVRDAGRLGLLDAHRVRQGLGMALYGPATKFRGWPERAEKARGQKRAQRLAAKAKLREMGVQPGAQITFRHRGGTYRGDVIRVNRCTVSVGEPGGPEVLMRVPFCRVLGIHDLA